MAASQSQGTLGFRSALFNPVPHFNLGDESDIEEIFERPSIL
jgi:hypothetical protein